MISFIYFTLSADSTTRRVPSASSWCASSWVWGVSFWTLLWMNDSEMTNSDLIFKRWMNYCKSWRSHAPTCFKEMLKVQSLFFTIIQKGKHKLQQLIVWAFRGLWAQLVTCQSSCNRTGGTTTKKHKQTHMGKVTYWAARGSALPTLFCLHIS